MQIRLPEHLRVDIEALKRLPISIPLQSVALPANAPQGIGVQGGQAAQAAKPVFVSLGEVASFEMTQGPNQISRENGKRRIVVTANVRGRDLGSFVNEAEQLINKKIRIPPGYWTTWAVNLSR